MTAPVTVLTLLGSSQLQTGLVCYSSLLAACSQIKTLLVFSDGTLGESAVESLTMLGSQVRVLSHSELDARASNIAAQYPNLYQLRGKNPLGRKFLDSCLYSILSEDDLVFCDSDVLFLGKADNLFYWPDANCSGVFMQDVQSAYCVSPYSAPARQLPSRCNTGLFMLRRSTIDLNVAESLCSTLSDKLNHPWIEQTLFAYMASRSSGKIYHWDPSLIGIPATTIPTLAHHYVSSIRHTLPTPRPPLTNSSLPLCWQQAEPCTPTTLLLDSLRRRFSH